MTNLEKILYASDFSADSLLAALYAFSCAEKFRAQLTMLHVIPTLPESPYLRFADGKSEIGANLDHPTA